MSWAAVVVVHVVYLHCFGAVAETSAADFSNFEWNHPLTLMSSRGVYKIGAMLTHPYTLVVNVCWSKRKLSPHLTNVYSVVDRPCGLETLQHALLQGLGQPMDPDEVLQILGAGVVEWAAWVHPLDDRCHITKYHCMHQRWRQRTGIWLAFYLERPSGKSHNASA